MSGNALRKRGGTGRMDPKIRTFRIETGPEKDAIIDHFKYVFSKRAEVPLEFVAYRYSWVAKKQKEYNQSPMLISDVRIIAMEYEDDTGNYLRLVGHCKAEIRPIEKVPAERTYKFEAKYNSKTKRGTISLYE